ncbi:hypothetical protein JP75_06640 [Devosia riboflavina]|uniref:Phage tail protein n=1 Tax=Devosia riboflavina TaxID=46914 RepID=A0A087M4D5_9HYPH|nr:phage tail protein [Devosia riboflavina]KFL31738.1 hypothetical protein JP75_06640 [Devosia riboflavina]
MTSALLPQNSTDWEKAVANALGPSVTVQSAINAMRRAKYVSPRPSMLDALIYEYGLGELTPYFSNKNVLIVEGPKWQRLRGTLSAIAIGLAWIGYSASVEEAWSGRRWWNSFQLRFAALPANDSPDLERIEGITRLSVPLRSMLRRGVFGYDVEAAQANHSRHNRSMWNFESGIAVTQVGTLWSFGRSYEFEHTLTEAEGMAIGNWIDPVESGGLKWVDMTVPWVDAHYRWAENPASLRRSVMAGWFATRTLWCRLRDSNGDVIGFRRCRAVRPVLSQLGGAYSHGGLAYEPVVAGQQLYVEAMTGFGDANAASSALVDLVVGGVLADGVKPGRLWLAPGELLGGTGIAGQAVDIPLRTTVREQFKFLMRF